MKAAINKSKIKKLTLLLAACYFISYVTRTNYGAIISEMENARHISKSLLSLALSGSAVTYALGQLASGFLGDRFQPKNLIFAGLATTVATNIAVPFAENVTLTVFIWCINGFAQAFMWPPIVKIMSNLYTKEEYAKGCIVVSCGSAVGTIAVYLISPLIIMLSGWRDVFFVSAGAAAVFSLFWLKLCPEIEIMPKIKKTRSEGSHKHIITPLMSAVMAAIILQGALRDGVTTWMPSFISETNNMSSSAAILTGVGLPVFAVISFKLAEIFNQKVIKNIMSCSGAIYLISAGAGALLFLTSGKNAVFSIIGCMLISGCMHGINLLLISFVPLYFSKTGRISLISGILNSCTYAGSAISVYGFAKVAEYTSWDTTLGMWFIISVLGGIICFASSGRWKKDMMG